MGLVVGVGWSAAGEGDLAQVAVAGEVVVDELGSVVGVDSQDQEREPADELVEAGGHDAFAFGAHGAGFGPAGGDVGGVEAVVEGAVVVAAFVADQVDLDEPGFGVVPLGPGLEWDRGLQQRAGFGVGDAFGSDQSGAVGLQVPVHGGR